MLRRYFLLGATLVTSTASRCLAADDPKQTGPLTLIIQYKCLAGQRAALRQHAAAGLHNFAQWKSDGILADYRILFSRYANSRSWDMAALLTFPNYAAAARWRFIEAHTPAGMPADALGLTTTVDTYPADLLRSQTASDPPRQPVYMVIPYTLSVAAPVYLQYADTYVIPQFEGWIREGVLSSFQLFMQRYTADRPWDVMIFLQYKDDAALGERESTVAKVRAQLMGNPAWKAASESKQSLRVEREVVIADDLSLVR